MIRFVLSVFILYISVQADEDRKFQLPNYLTTSTTTTKPTKASKPTKPAPIFNTTIPEIQVYRYGDSYYYFQTLFKGSYYQAIQFCNIYRMKLVSIETPQENQFLYDELKHFFGKGETDLWTSGTALVSDQHTFYWISTGQKVGYSSWAVGQPDDAGNNEKCLHVIYNKKQYATLVWNDHVCTKDKYFICEIDSKQCSNTLDSECTPFTIISN